MILDDETARITASVLLQINAIKLKPENPFTWASGWQSPIYCDNRILLSYPEHRKFVAEALAHQTEALYGTPDLIVGVATGAIGVGLLTAEILGVPFAYVRPKPKEHGRQNQIEGRAEAGQRTVVIEDLISTGMSSLRAIDALRAADLDVRGMLGIFTYGFDKSVQAFKDANLQVHTLSNYDHLIALAESRGYIKSEQLRTLRDWRTSPQTWKP